MTKSTVHCHPQSRIPPQHQPASLKERADLPHPGAPPKSQTARACLVLCFFTSSSQIPTQDTTNSISDPPEEPRPSPSKRTLFIRVQSMHSQAPLYHTIFFINSMIMFSPPTPIPIKDSKDTLALCSHKIGNHILIKHDSDEAPNIRDKRTDLRQRWKVKFNLRSLLPS